MANRKVQIPHFKDLRVDLTNVSYILLGPILPKRLVNVNKKLQSKS